MKIDAFDYPQIQVALDPPLDLTSLCELARRTYKGGARIIEAGTPALKLHGAKNILPRLRKAVPESLIVADTKTMDVGDLEAKIVFDHGADVVTVLGVGGEKKIQEALNVAKKRKKAILIDLIDVQRPLHRIKQLKKHLSGIPSKRVIFALHRGISEQRKKGAGISTQRKLITQAREIIQESYIALAGGLKKGEIRSLAPYADIFIVGSAITNARNPQEITRKLTQEVTQGSLE